LVIAYPLSYAPVMRFKLEQSSLSPMRSHLHPPIDVTELPIYQSVDWLIDNTPLRKPLIAWAEFWGVEDEFCFKEQFRALVRSRLKLEAEQKRLLSD
jgi:hypothetical protein